MFKNKKIMLLLVISLCFISMMTYRITTSNARYKNESSGSAEGEIADFRADISSQSNNVNIIAGESATYTVEVSSDSDVYVGYSINIQNIPNDILVKLDNGSFVTPSNNEVTFSDVGQLEYDGVNVRSHIITFSTTLSTNNFNANNVTINVYFEQV